MADIGVPNVNFEGFMAYIAQENQNAVKKIYRDGDPSLPMVDRERTCIFHKSASLDKVMQNYIKASLQLKHAKNYKEYKDIMTMDNAKTKYDVIRSQWNAWMDTTCMDGY